jgi:hypothetical protein
LDSVDSDRFGYEGAKDGLLCSCHKAPLHSVEPGWKGFKPVDRAAE